MPSRPSDLIRGAIAGAATAAASWFYIEHAGGLYRISRAELAEAMRAQGVVVMDGNGDAFVNRRFSVGSLSAAPFTVGLPNANSAAFSELAYLICGNNPAGSNFTRLLIGQLQTNVMFLEAGNQANTKGAIVLQPYGGAVGVGASPLTLADFVGGANGPITCRIANGDMGNGAIARYQVDLTARANAYALFGISANAGSPFAYLETGSAVGNLYLGATGAMQFNVAGVGKVYIDSSALRPSADNAISYGTGSFRPTMIYAVSGSINTSQRSEKASIVYLSREALTDLRASALLRVGARLCDLTTSFQWKASILEKGQAAYDALPLEERANTTPELEGAKLARFHTGWIHDDAVAAFTAEDLDPYREGAICLDPKVVKKTRMVETTIQATEEVPDPEFDVVVEEGKARRVPRAGTIAKPVFRDVLLFAEDGVTPIMVPVPGTTSLVDGQGNPIPQMRQATYSEPVMVAGPPREETYDEEVEGEHVESLRVDYLQTLCLAALKAGVTIPPEE